MQSQNVPKILLGVSVTVILTDGDPHWNVPSAAEIRNEDHRYDISNLVATRDESRETRGDLETLLDGCNHRINVSRA